MTPVTPDVIDMLDPNQIFVFGSNEAGRHGKGAALVAIRNFGAKRGQGYGRQGQSFAIPTKSAEMKTLRLSTIKVSVDKFICYANNNKHLSFLVTRIGCGLAGYKDTEIAPLFKEALNTPNISLPLSFVKILGTL